MEKFIFIVVCIFAICFLLWVGRKMGEYGFSGKILKIAKLYKLEKEVQYAICSVMKVARLPIDACPTEDTYYLSVMVRNLESLKPERMISLDRADFVTVTDEQWATIATASSMDLTLDMRKHVIGIRIGRLYLAHWLT